MTALSYSPVNRLPTELIRQILIEASQVDHQYRDFHDRRTHAPYFPYTGLFICKAWSSVLMSTPEVWRSVFLLFNGSRYKPERALVRIRRHQLLSRSLNAEMHLDLYYRPVNYDRCNCGRGIYIDSPCKDQFCCVREVMGPANLWGSLRVIVANEKEVTLDYVYHRLISSISCGPFQPLRCLRRLAIISHHGYMDITVMGNEVSLAKILEETPDLEDLVISNLQVGYESDKRGDDIVDVPSLVTLTLEGTTTNAIRFLDYFRFTKLQEVRISNINLVEMEPDKHEYGEIEEGDETVLEGVFGSAHTAILGFWNSPVARLILVGLPDVKRLELTSPDSNFWPRLLAESTYCENVKTLEFHRANFGPDLDLLKKIVETRIDSLESIRVPSSFEGPLDISVGETTIKLERLSTRDFGF